MNDANSLNKNTDSNQKPKISCKDDFETFLNGRKYTFCYNMSFYRISKKITMERLSFRTGIAQDILEQYQIGTCDFNFEDICKIAFALNITVEDLFRE